MMLEITYEKGKQQFLDFGFREVSTNIDSAGRKNWVFVYEEEDWCMLPDVEDLEKIVDRELEKLKDYE